MHLVDDGDATDADVDHETLVSGAAGRDVSDARNPVGVSFDQAERSPDCRVGQLQRPRGVHGREAGLQVGAFGCDPIDLRLECSFGEGALRSDDVLGSVGSVARFTLVNPRIATGICRSIRDRSGIRAEAGRFLAGPRLKPFGVLSVDPLPRPLP